MSQVLQNYAAVGLLGLSSLEAMANTSGETAATCRPIGLLQQFCRGVTVVYLKIAVTMFSLLEQLNKSYKYTGHAHSMHSRPIFVLEQVNAYFD